MPNENDPKDGPPPLVWVGLLRCHKCGKTVECTADEMLRYARTGQPQCCSGATELYELVPKAKPPMG